MLQEEKQKEQGGPTLHQHFNLGAKANSGEENNEHKVATSQVEVQLGVPDPEYQAEKQRCEDAPGNRLGNIVVEVVE